MPVLNCTVIVRDDTFVTHVFLAGDEPPAWAVKKITNPNVWANASAAVARNRDTADSAAEPETPATVRVPPKAGRGSSAKAWAAYALAQGFAVEGDATATEIREALQEQGIPTE
ncbi:hypothetical protein [Curtobacterium sp. MCSS17_015]|uniref:hypothetical protein n=1 Tax=Curtobacterium sp. MCSS17_015 TaxID=2175666 RepID=UPI000DA6EEBA|nr:hypothetical protein [Curtobacterium sp. MCSS17_015]WIB25818.1 hypothetical protein DEJ18_12280 [Curtobacterium sp. MCSS17_015]